METTYPPTPVTWALVIFGLVTCLPLAAAQLLMLFAPESRRTRDILVGKGGDWRDETHFSSSRGMAWADWILLIPFLAAGSFGVIGGTLWGYVLWAIAGSLSVYISVILWFQEKRYVFPARGPLVYYSYYWGNFVYWGAAAVIYSLVRLTGR